MRARACTLVSVQDPYAAIARFYDRAVGEGGDDVALCEALAGRYGDPVLEIGAGTGRIAVPLALAGHSVVALDPSPAMLAIGRERAAAAGARVCWHEGRIETLELPQRFGLILCAADSFLHLGSREAQEAALRVARRLLRAGGCFALDLPTLASWSDWQPGVRPLELLWSERADGVTTSHYSSFQADPARQVRRMTHIFEESGADGSVRRWISSFDLRFVGRFELELLLERAGLQLHSLYGDYALGPLHAESERMIALAGAAEEEA